MKIPRRKHKADVPSVAMGDIAFNLLIFFVILAKAQDDSHLNWTPASTAKVESAGVTRVRLRPSGTKGWKPSSSSSSLICLLTPGCDVCSFSAAAVMLSPVWATAAR